MGVLTLSTHSARVAFLAQTGFPSAAAPIHAAHATPQWCYGSGKTYSKGKMFQEGLTRASTWLGSYPSTKTTWAPSGIQMPGVFSSFFKRPLTTHLYLLHSWGPGSHPYRYTGWAGSRSHCHRYACRQLERQSVQLQNQDPRPWRFLSR